MSLFNTISGLTNNGLRGVPTIGKYLSYQRAYNWDILVPASKGLIFGELLSEHIQDVSFGEYGFTDVKKNANGAFKTHYPGTLDVDSIKLTFVKPVPDIVTGFFRAWRDEIVSREGYYSPKADYKENIFILMMSNNTVFPATERFKAIGCFPKSMPTHSLSYGDEKIVTLTVELSVDRVEPFSLIQQFGTNQFTDKLGALGNFI